MLTIANYNFQAKVIILFILIFTFKANAIAQPNTIITGAEQTDKYLPLLKNKNVGLIVNHSSLINQTHLVDSLLKLGVNIKTVFAPEHGFRGDKDAGQNVNSGRDVQTNLPIISLYGSNKKPSQEMLQNLDILIFDIQDVGTRFYTYISTMHYVMEACAENEKEMIVLDRPNPNGMYIDGPVLEQENKSFVGMHPIPILHGLTVGELAKMINGEFWLSDSLQCDLHIVSMKNYTHSTSYILPVKPSPNLPNSLSIQLYPSLCLFEGTVISVGRGTEKPFQQIGHPLLERTYNYTFTPESMPGALNPPYKGEKCYGIKFSNQTSLQGFDLNYLIEMYKAYPNQDEFFNNFFIKLAGTSSLEAQIKAGFSTEEIKLSWQSDLENYKHMRALYLIYPE